MAANITSCHGRNGDLAVNLCYKQQLLKGAQQGIKRKSSFLKIVQHVNGNTIRKFSLIYYSSSTPPQCLSKGDENRQLCKFIMWDSEISLSKAVNWKRQDLIWYLLLSPY